MAAEPSPTDLSGWTQLRMFPPTLVTFDMKITRWADPNEPWHTGMSLRADLDDTMAIETGFVIPGRDQERTVTRLIRRFLSAQAQAFEPF